MVCCQSDCRVVYQYFEELALFPLFLRLLYRDYLGYRFRYLYHVIAQGTKAIHLFPKDRMEIDKPNLSPEHPLD